MVALIPYIYKYGGEDDSVKDDGNEERDGTSDDGDWESDGVECEWKLKPGWVQKIKNKPGYKVEVKTSLGAECKLKPGWVQSGS